MSERAGIRSRRAAAPGQRQAAKEPEKQPAAAPTATGPLQKAGPAVGLDKPIQRQVAMGTPGDRFEQEADSVADKVTGGESVDAGAISPVSANDLGGGGAKEPVQGKGASGVDEQRPDATPVQKAAAAPEQQEQKVAQKAAATPEQRPPEPIAGGAVQKDAAAGTGGSGGEGVAAGSAIASKGAGKPLAPETRGTLESRLGADLGDVRVHDDASARASARAINARAFTHGNDIWLGPGASQNDTRLMAHEATHVVQQSGGLHRMVQKAGKPASTGAAGPPAAFREKPGKPNAYVTTLTLPAVKARFGHTYSAWASGDKLYRAADYKRGNPNQKDGIWLKQVTISPQALKPLGLDKPFTGAKDFMIHGKKRGPYDYEKWLDLLRVPNWDRHGTPYPYPFEVDHMVELQTAGWPKSGAGNELANMELLDKSSNASAGSSIRADIAGKVSDFLATPDGKKTGAKSTAAFLTKNDIYFDKVQHGGDARTFQNWTREEIEQGLPAKDAVPIHVAGKPGSATSFAVMDPTGTAVLAEYPHKQKDNSFAITGTKQTAIGGLRATSISLDSGYETATAASAIGNIQVTWDLPQGIKVPKSANIIPIVKAAQGQYAGVLGKVPGLAADLTGASPIEFPDVSFDGSDVAATGHIKPTIPLLSKLPIEARLLGREVEFGFTYSPETINFNIPGLRIEDCSIGLFYGSKGLRAEGSLDFSVPEAAHGGVGVKINAAGEFEAEGHLSFDPGLFDKSMLKVWYRNKAWGASGDLAITKPGKIRGIRTASIKALLDANRFKLDGNVEPDIPAVESAGLSIEVDEKTGVTFIGDLALKKDTPGIDGGNIHIVAQRPPGGDGFKVSGSGTAKPKIPGVDSELKVTYDDGLFDAALMASYNKGRVKGSILVGATNRPVTDGQPSGPAPPKPGPITVYGGGTVTVVLTPWLQGTVGVKLLPQGEIELMGEIALPSALDLFPEKKFDKTLFKPPPLDIPIIGVSAAGHRIGIFATINGGLDVSAGIGPGQLQKLSLKVTYNPSHEESAHIEGDASLHVPAHAGLRLYVRGGLGAGIPLVSAEAGIELGATLGLEGALDTGVQVDWTPAQGLVLDAQASVYVEPKLKIDLSAYVDVELDALVTSFTLYSNKWQLAGFEYGSNLRFGVSFPVHYDESKGFDLSLDKLDFQVPDIDPKAVLSDILAKIT